MSTQTILEQEPAINVAVVGHTNTGKTSLIRTLLRSKKFGEIANSAGTTRHVESTTLLANGKAVLSMFDTPGLEDASALLDVLDGLSKNADLANVTLFLQTLDQHIEFEQEAKVLRQGLNSDALLYVIDVRAPLLEKYHDELNILSRLGKPIIPVFNFIVGQEQQLGLWRDMMITFNLHAALEFDTVAFDFEAEKRLYQKLQSVLEARYEHIQTLIDARKQDWELLSEAAVHRSAQLIIDAVTLRVAVEGGMGSVAGNTESGGRQQANKKLQESLRKLEKKCLKDLLKLFSFSNEDIDVMQLPVSEGEWQLDLFSLDTIRMFGLDARSSALKGAAAGAGVDLMTGGLSLGAATALGAVLGAGFSTARRYGKDIAASFRGDDIVCADDITIELLYLRQQDLLYRLMHRGHAAQGGFSVDNKGQQKLPENWKEILAGLRRGQLSRKSSNKAFGQSDAQLRLALAMALDS